MKIISCKNHFLLLATLTTGLPIGYQKVMSMEQKLENLKFTALQEKHGDITRTGSRFERLDGREFRLTESELKEDERNGQQKALSLVHRDFMCHIDATRFCKVIFRVKNHTNCTHNFHVAFTLYDDEEQTSQVELRRTGPHFIERKQDKIFDCGFILDLKQHVTCRSVKFMFQDIIKEEYDCMVL